MNLVQKFLEKRNERKLFLKMFPKSLSDDVLEVCKIIPVYQRPHPYLNTRKAHDTVSLIVNGEPIELPYRINNDIPVEMKNRNLTEKQKIILDCVYSMHYDGHKREDSIKNIITSKEWWVIPFIVKTLGDYVFEITKLIEISLNESKNLRHYGLFIKNNKKYWEYLQARSISYWDIFYRKEYKKYNDIPTIKIAKLLKKNLLLSKKEYVTVKEKLISLIKDVLGGVLTYEAFSTELETYFWTEGVYDILEEIDDDFFYRVYECSTYVSNEEAGQWGLRSAEDYLKWLDKSTKEYLDNKNNWYKRVKGELDMWA